MHAWSSLSQPPARRHWRLFGRRNVDRVLRAVDFTKGAQGAILRISRHGLLAILVHPDYVHGATVYTYPTTIALAFVNTFNRHGDYLLLEKRTLFMPFCKHPQRVSPHRGISWHTFPYKVLTGRATTFWGEVPLQPPSCLPCL